MCYHDPMRIDKDRLEGFRKLYAESPRRFSIRIGVSYQWYYDLIDGENNANPRLETIQTIADALGIPAKDLIK